MKVPGAVLIVMGLGGANGFRKKYEKNFKIIKLEINKRGFECASHKNCNIRDLGDA